MPYVLKSDCSKQCTFSAASTPKLITECNEMLSIYAKHTRKQLIDLLDANQIEYPIEAGDSQLRLWCDIHMPAQEASSASAGLGDTNVANAPLRDPIIMIDWNQSEDETVDHTTEV